MRTKLTLAGLVVGLGATLAPLSPASAYCDETFRELTGYCNPCYLTGGVYQQADRRLGVLPDADWNCPA